MECAGILERAAEMLSQAIQETREVARGYVSNEAYAAGGILVALQALAEKSYGDIWCVFRCHLDTWPLGQEKSAQVYRIAQEALSNAVRHSGAQRVILEVAEEANSMVLRVADDGRGLPTRGASSRGLGVKIMEQRATSLGARLDIQSHPGGGTTVTCRVPRAVEP